MIKKKRRRLKLILYFSGAALLFLFAFTLFEPSSTRRRLSGGGVECHDALDSIVPLAIPVYFLLLMICFVGVGVVTDDWFVPALSLVSKSLNLSDDVAGATFMASASSAPELFTSLVDTFWSKTSIGIGTIVGSAVFNILVIIACSGAFSDSEENPNGLLIDWRPLFRDIAFYLISIYELVHFIYLDQYMGNAEGRAYWWEGLIMFATYILYVIIWRSIERFKNHFAHEKETISKRRKLYIFQAASSPACPRDFCAALGSPPPD